MTRRYVLVTGGHGFLGTHVVKQLQSAGHHVYSPTHASYDLMEKREIFDMLNGWEPEVIVHLAAAVGGIAANQSNPGSFFYRNIVMGAELMEAARVHGVKKYIQMGTSCSYPAVTVMPAREASLWTGYPNEITAPYGIAKLALITQAQAYRRQYGFNAVTLIPANLYGPGDATGDQGHVVPALIEKCLEAGKNSTPLTVWGSGQAGREFLYVDDCARAIALAIDGYDKPEPVNLGTGKETRIAEVVSLIANAVGFKGDIVWDATKPDGQLHRRFDVTRAKEELGFEAMVTLEEGVQRTVDWYKAR